MQMRVLPSTCAGEGELHDFYFDVNGKPSRDSNNNNKAEARGLARRTCCSRLASRNEGEPTVKLEECDNMTTAPVLVRLPDRASSRLVGDAERWAGDGEGWGHHPCGGGGNESVHFSFSPPVEVVQHFLEPPRGSNFHQKCEILKRSTERMGRGVARRCSGRLS